MGKISFGEMWATLTEEQREYFAKYIDRQRQNAVDIYIEKQCNIGAVSGHVPEDIQTFLHRLRLAEHSEIRKEAVALFERHCR